MNISKLEVRVENVGTDISMRAKLYTTDGDCLVLDDLSLFPESKEEMIERKSSISVDHDVGYYFAWKYHDGMFIIVSDNIREMIEPYCFCYEENKQYLDLLFRYVKAERDFNDIIDSIPVGIDFNLKWLD